MNIRQLRKLEGYTAMRALQSYWLKLEDDKQVDYPCRLLAENTADIAFVSMECGFKSILNFNRVFKKPSGITPGE